MKIEKLDFSHFHPLDHPIWHPYCWKIDTKFPEAPHGWKCVMLHFQYWREFMWDDPFITLHDKREIVWRDRLRAVRKLVWF